MPKPPTLLASTDGRVLAQFRAYLESAEEVVLASAFVSAGALEMMLPDLERIARKDGTIQLYAAFDGGAFTRPDAFRKLIELKRAHPARVGLYVNPRQGSLFHAKVFLFRNRHGWRGLVGSANLTARGLSGANFEVCTDWPELSTKEVEKVRSELSRLRTRSQLTDLTPEKLDEVLRLYVPLPELSPTEQNLQDRLAKAARERLNKRIKSLKPGTLAPLPPLEESAREWTEALAATGRGVAVTTELAELSISLQVDPFVKANIVAKETTRQLGLATESTRKGYSISLVPHDLRQRCSTAARSVGRLIGFRSIDLGVSRWLPERFVVPLELEIEHKDVVRSAQRALEDESVIDTHLRTIRAQFDQTVRQTVAELAIRPSEDWNLEASVFDQYKLTVGSSTEDVRRAISDYMKKAHGTRISKAFVWSQLCRVSFQPRTFVLPIEQRMGSDLDYGHKAFLSGVVWAFSDRVLKHDDDGAHGAGELFDYLRSRHDLNAPRRQKRGARIPSRELADVLSQAAATWLDPHVALTEAVETVRSAFGPEPWTWQVADL